MTRRTFIRVYSRVSLARVVAIPRSAAYLQVLHETLKKGNEVFGSSNVARNSFLQ